MRNMATNDPIILDHILEVLKLEIAPDLNDPDFFELFTAEQILKDFDLSYDEIESGIVDGGGDGGIDSIYLFINGELIAEDTELDKFKGAISIELYIIQAKTNNSFSESSVEKLKSTTEDLLDLHRIFDGLERVYNDRILRVMRKFSDVNMRFAARYPELKISYYFVTKGNKNNVHPNVQRKVDKLEETVSGLFSSAEFSFKFLGAGELLVLARRSPTRVYTLNLVENLISTGETNYACLARLNEYYKFITDSQNKIVKSLFEANVRDYQRNVEVNNGIQYTLRNPQDDEDFWWLNNGITIVATAASQFGGKTLQIISPQIVNGLQTSEEIYKYFKDLEDPSNDERNVLVRVIIPTRPEICDRIIKATNSQTTIPTASLRATDPIHKNIEDFLKPHGFYYDRRKNYYKNEKKPIGKIISISYLAQAVMSIVLRKPDYARARPSSLMKKDDDYKEIFNSEYPIQLYLQCVKIIKSMENFLRQQDISLKHANNIKFHLAMFSALLLAKDNQLDPDKLATLSLSTLNDNFIEICYNEVCTIYKNLGASDQVAKNRNFAEKLIDRLENIT